MRRTSGSSWQRAWAFLFGFLGPVIVGWLLYDIVELWPRVLDDTAAPQRVALGFGVGWRLGPDQSFLLLAAQGGLLGGLLYTMGVYASRRSSGRFRPQDANWYWVRCVVGAGLGLAVYVLLRAGLFLLGGTKDTNPPTPHSVLAVSMVAGLFTDKVLRKLNEIAGNFFATKDELDAAQGIKRASIQSWSPHSLARGVAGQQLTLDVAGLGMGHPVALRINGVAVPDPGVGTDGRLSVPVEERFVTAQTELLVEIDAGDGATSSVKIPIEPVQAGSG